MKTLPRIVAFLILIGLAGVGWSAGPQAAYDEVALVIADLSGSCDYPGYENTVCAVHYEHLTSPLPGGDSCSSVMRVYFTDWAVHPILQQHLDNGRAFSEVFVRLFRESQSGASEQVAWIRLGTAKVAKLQNVLWRSSTMKIQGMMMVEFSFDRILWHSVAGDAEFSQPNVNLCAETLPPPKSDDNTEELRRPPRERAEPENEIRAEE
jgi:type VI protein secretion system component Hcp